MTEIFRFCLNFLASRDDTEAVWDDFIEKEHKNEKYSYNQDAEKIMEAIADSYSNANHWSTRRQLLSIVADDVPFRIIKKYIADLTRGKYYEARRQAKNNG